MRMSKRKKLTVLLMAALVLMFAAGCGAVQTEDDGRTAASSAGSAAYEEPEQTEDSSVQADNSGAVDIGSIPPFSGEPSVEVNGNEPGFTDEEIRIAKEEGVVAHGMTRAPEQESAGQESTDGVSEAEAKGEEELAPLDGLGRCGAVTACVGTDTMPEGERESIGMIRPSGWPEKIADAKYDFIDGGFLWNRCHLLGWQLTGENAEERNLITGTRYMNVEGMLPYENEVAEYVKRTGNRVLYRATPAFEGDEPVARGVQLEAYSLEDDGEGVSFNVYCYNVQPDIEIDYMTGESRLAEGAASEVSGSGNESSGQAAGEGNGQTSEKRTFVLNTNPERKRYHMPDCNSVDQIKDKNKKVVESTPEELEAEGYVPCGNCHPDMQ